MNLIVFGSRWLNLHNVVYSFLLVDIGCVYSKEYQTEKQNNSSKISTLNSRELNILLHTCNPNTWIAERFEIQGHPELHNDILSKNIKNIWLWFIHYVGTDCFSFNSIYSSATFGVVWIAEKVSLNCIFSRSTQRSPLCFIGSVRKVLSEGSRWFIVPIMKNQ